MTRIQDLQVAERPREKLCAAGASSLSDVELLATVLGSGGNGKDVLTLAAELLPIMDRRNGDLKPSDLMEAQGIGMAKATLLCAALEYSRRRIKPASQKIRDAADVYALVRHLADRKQEHFITITLNGAHEVIALRVVTVGLVNSSQIHPREVFADAITDRACGLIICHNHPSGELEPSPSDNECTKRLNAAGDLLGIRLLDHVIFSVRGYLSYQEKGLMR